MSIELVSLLLSSISSISSLVQAYHSTRGIERRDMDSRMSYLAFGKRAPEPYSSKTLSKEEIETEAQEFDKVIDDDILETLVNTIIKAKRRLIDALNDPSNTEQAKSTEMEAVRSIICRALKRIKDLNNGTLPGNELNKVSISFSCAK